MKIKYYDPFVDIAGQDEKVTSLENLYSSCDIVSIHIPIGPETQGIVTKELLANVKPGFMLVNTSRGLIVNSQEVKELLQSGKLAYLAADVWGENNEFDPDLLLDNAFQSDHVAFFTEEAVKSILEQTKQSYDGQALPENTL
jgi:lactate dehydrogenase-like 2-hydroxyacid dehydrogenase